VRILVYRLGSLGDTVVALPCFRRIRDAYPDATILVLTNVPVSGKAAPLAAVLENTGLIDGVIPYPVGLRDPKQLAELGVKLSRAKFDLAISLTAARGFAASVRDYLFFRTCGISKIIGIPWHRRDLVCAEHDGVYENEADRLLRRVASLPAPGKTSDLPDLGLTATERTDANLLLEKMAISPPFIVASVGTKSLLKDWGLENWRALLAELGRDFSDHGLVLLGSPDESARSDDLARTWPGPHANLCGQTSPRLSAAVLEQARLFVGHDSGPAHLAAAAGTPTIAIFSAQSRPGQWFPRGPRTTVLYPYSFFDPQRMEDAGHQRLAIGSITVADVLQAAKSCLSPEVSLP
jgi:heptosyltransferase III